MVSLEANSSAENGGEAPKPKSLFADDNVARCFFRRLSFSPDGSLLIVPTGLMKPSLLQSVEAKSRQSSSAFATHIFHRSDLSAPVVSLAGLDEPSVAVRCCPRLFKMVQHSQPVEGFPGDYRMVFAVATTSSVLIYDTQHLAAPLMKLCNLHYATINDVAWSANGVLGEKLLRKRLLPSI